MDEGKGGYKRTPGAGRRPVQPEIEHALFNWFVDICVGLKGRISSSLLLAKCKQLHKCLVETKEVSEEEENKIKMPLTVKKSCCSVNILCTVCPTTKG